MTRLVMNSGIHAGFASGNYITNLLPWLRTQGERMTKIVKKRGARVYAKVLALGLESPCFTSLHVRLTVAGRLVDTNTAEEL
jgi:hypothetical protein